MATKFVEEGTKTEDSEHKLECSTIRRITSLKLNEEFQRLNNEEFYYHKYQIWIFNSIFSK